MPAKRPAPKSAKGKKAASRPALRKPLRVAAPPAPPPATAAMITANRSPAAHAVNADGDDGETIEPGSLLAGPRNVQPYIAKRGEQYMSKQQLEHFRLILNSWKRDLMVEVDRTVTHMKDEAANFPDPNDRATQEEEVSLELGEELGIKRLEARPVATLSIEAQERRERRERQYGDRDDRYR